MQVSEPGSLGQPPGLSHLPPSLGTSVFAAHSWAGVPPQTPGPPRGGPGTCRSFPLLGSGLGAPPSGDPPLHPPRPQRLLRTPRLRSPNRAPARLALPNSGKSDKVKTSPEQWGGRKGPVPFLLSPTEDPPRRASAEKEAIVRLPPTSATPAPRPTRSRHHPEPLHCSRVD